MQGPSLRRSARSAGEQQELWGRMGPGWRPCAVEDASDVVGGFDDLEDAHAAAALATDGDVDGERAGEELGPTDASRTRRGVRGVAGLVVRAVREAERELPGRRDGEGWNDARAKMMAICEHAEVPGHVKTRWRYEGTQPCKELVGARPAAPSHSCAACDVRPLAGDSRRRALAPASSPSIACIRPAGRHGSASIHSPRAWVPGSSTLWLTSGGI